MNKEIEIWKDVDGYEGLYQVSSMGRVKSLGREYIDSKNHKRFVKERILRPYNNGHGYLFVVLCKDGERNKYKVHRLVCRAFVHNDDPENKTVVSHLDETRNNNCASNLCWATTKENLNMPLYKQRRSDASSKEVFCVELKLKFKSLKDAANFIGQYNTTHLSEHLKGKLKSCGKNPKNKKQRLHWTYA